MALQSRNIALEGLAAEFLTAEGIAVLGFAEGEEGDGVEWAAAATETLVGHVVPLQVAQPLGGGGGWSLWEWPPPGSLRRVPSVEPEPVPAPIAATINEVAPSAADDVAGEVVVTAQLIELGPAAAETVRCIGSIRARLTESAPTADDVIVADVREPPAVVVAIQAPPTHQPLSVSIVEDAPAATDDAQGRALVALALTEAAPPATDHLAANVFRADWRRAERRADQFAWRRGWRAEWLTERRTRITALLVRHPEWATPPLPQRTLR